VGVGIGAGIFSAQAIASISEEARVCVCCHRAIWDELADRWAPDAEVADTASAAASTGLSEYFARSG
jgi:hypothetical protein